MPDRRYRRDPLAEAIRRIALGRSHRAPARPRHEGDLSARLAAMEREIADVRTRVNALFFTVLAAAIGDLLARTVLG